MKREEAVFLYALLIGGQGYDSTVEEYVEGCEDIESAELEAKEELGNGKLWFGETCSWHEYSLEDVEWMEDIINSFEREDSCITAFMER